MLYYEVLVRSASWARVTYEVGFEVSHGSGALKGLQELLPFLYIALGFVGVQNGE